MPPANEHGAQPARAAVDRQLLDAARHRSGKRTAESHGHWTACSAPGRIVVVDTNGSLRACEYGAESLADPSTPFAELLERAEAQLGTALAEAGLPLPHCRGCAIWCGADLHAAAPLVRDYGAPRGDAAERAQVVVRLDGDGHNVRADDTALATELDRFGAVAIEGDDVFASATAMALLERWRGRDDAPTVAVRTRHLPDADAVCATLTGLTVQSLELDVDSIDEAAITSLAAATRRLDAEATVRFTLTPAGWFDFERAIEAAAANDIRVDLRILDRTGSIPLDALGAEQAAVVRDAVIDCWPRLHGQSRPASLGDGDFDRLCQELRLIVGRRVAASQEEGTPLTTLSLPPLDHQWHSGPAAAYWHRRLMWRSHTRLIRNWLDQVVDRDSLQQHTWLRALVHRVTFETQAPALLDALREAYGNQRLQRRMAEEDERFAAQFELHRFGGPWAQRIGLGPPKARRRPFTIDAATPAGGPADVTVLIPSYRHARFIKQTLQSVLAQRDVQFRVLVADDRSPDRTVAVARAVDDPRLEVRVNEHNVGLGNSVLQALATIDTEFVALLNSDDLLHPEHLATCRQALRDAPSAMLVCTDIQPIDAKGGKLEPDNVSLVRDGKQVFEWIHWFARVNPAGELAPEQLFGELLERNYLITSSNLFARTDWLRRQADALRSLKYCLDWRLFLQAAAEGALVHVRKPLIAYRLHGSNTVWFDADRRYTYYLEVNRVVAEALRQFAKHHPDPDVAIERVLDAVAHHVTHNGEIDGYALFLNAALDTLRLDRIATESPRARELLLELSAAADRRRTGADASAAAGTEAQMLSLELEHLRSLLNAERGQRRWLQVASDQQATTLARAEEISRNIWAEKQQLEQVRNDLTQRLQATQQSLEAAQQAHRQVNDELQSMTAARDELRAAKQQLAEELDQERGRLAQRAEEIAALLSRAEQLQHELTSTRAQREELTQELAATDAQLVRTRDELTSTAQTLTAERSAHDATRATLETTRAALDSTNAALDSTRASLDSTNAALDSTRRELETTNTTLSSTRQDLSTTRGALQHEHQVATGLRSDLASVRGALRAAHQQQQQTRAELDRTLTSREYRLGNFVWNKLPLASLSRRLKKWYRKLLDLRTRFALRRLGAPKSAGRAVVAATRVWPVYSHTFVYQEVTSMLESGIDVRFFYWDEERPMRLHAAFDALRRRRVQLQAVWGNHERDRAWFERTRPQQFAAFLERIAGLTGRSTASLRDDGIVLRGSTFARMVELSRATYLHSYFFYDMSFMAMMAAWLLGLPRGITCYADHMLDDYPWKFVPLQLELCDVVVATSERIKRELSQISQGRFDDKIVVKPNGVDGRRFPAIERPQRQAGAPIELLSVSRLEPKKGLIHLVGAVAQLAASGHHVVVHVVGSADPHSVGSTEYAEQFRERIREAGLDEQFVLHGALQQEQLPPLLQRCRAFIAPYVEVDNGDKDGIPTAVLEAMASRLPIVATDSGSLLEVITDDREGLVVPQRDAAALAAAIRRLIEHPELEQRLAAAARARFEQAFDTAVTEQRLHERIRSILAARS